MNFSNLIWMTTVRSGSRQDTFRRSSTRAYRKRCQVKPDPFRPSDPCFRSVHVSLGRHGVFNIKRVWHIGSYLEVQLVSLIS